MFLKYVTRSNSTDSYILYKTLQSNKINKFESIISGDSVKI